MPPSDSTAVANEFLLAEFNALQERARHFEDLKASRVNFLLIIYAAALATMPTIYDKFSTMATQTTLVVAVVLLVVGITSLNQVVYYSAYVVVFYRRAGRIRRWFVEQAPEIAPYVAFSPRDDSPTMLLSGAWMVLRGADGVLLALNSVSIAVASVCLLIMNLSGPVTDYLVLIAGATFAVAGFGQWLWIQQVLGGEAKRQANEVHFNESEQMKRRYRGEGPGYDD